MKKKKWSLFLACIGLSLALTACGTGNSSNENGGTTGADTAAESQTQISDTADTAENQETEQEQTVESETVENTNETTVAGEVGTYPDGTSPEFSGVKCKLTVDGEEVIIAMYDNSAADAFLERMPLEGLSFYDLSGIEKPAETLDDPFSIEDETPGYDPVTGEMVIYRPWGNFTIFYGDFRHSDELVPLGIVESGLDILSSKTDDFSGTMEIME